MQALMCWFEVFVVVRRIHRHARYHTTPELTARSVRAEVFGGSIRRREARRAYKLALTRSDQVQHDA